MKIRLILKYTTLISYIVKWLSIR